MNAIRTIPLYGVDRIIGNENVVDLNYKGVVCRIVREKGLWSHPRIAEPVRSLNLAVDRVQTSIACDIINGVITPR